MNTAVQQHQEMVLNASFRRKNVYRTGSTAPCMHAGGIDIFQTHKNGPPSAPSSLHNVGLTFYNHAAPMNGHCSAGGLFFAGLPFFLAMMVTKI